MSDLPFVPKGADRQFNPKSHNWTRSAKVPMLVLNATTLNTGHNWQFTGTWMGEAATTIDNRIDSNDYLRRMYYSEAPGVYRCKGVRLGHAVAASACVPGLFPALKLPKLYERHPVVRLVDGGVHDNQGIAALLDQDCSVILVSDASGQMRSAENPPGGVFGGPARANSVLQARVRLAQYREIDARRRSGALRGLMWVHLREELEPDAIDWIDCRDRFSREDEGLPEKEPEPLTGYGVRSRDPGCARPAPYRSRQLLGCRGARTDVQRVPDEPVGIGAGRRPLLEARLPARPRGASGRSSST